MSTATSMADAFRHYVSLGLLVMALKPLSKVPMGKFIHLYETPLSIEKLEELFWSFPEAGLAILTGHLVDVLDVEQAGIELLDHLLPWHGPVALTPNGGAHFYCQPGTLRGRQFNHDGIHYFDVKAGRNQYVAADPTSMKAGTYEWLDGQALGEVPLPKPPEWLIAYAGADGVRGVTQCRRQAKADLVRLIEGGTDMLVGSAGGHGTRTPFVTPPPSSTKVPGVDRSRDDAKLSDKLLGEGVSFEDVVEEIESTSEKAAERHDDYARRTVEAVSAALDARCHEAVIAYVYSRPEVMEIVFRFLEPPFESVMRPFPLDWPETDRSRARWEYLRAAVDVTGWERPEQLVGARLRVELIERGTKHRVGRFFPSLRGAEMSL